MGVTDTVILCVCVSCVCVFLFFSLLLPSQVKIITPQSINNQKTHLLLIPTQSPFLSLCLKTLLFAVELNLSVNAMSVDLAVSLL